MHVRTIPLLNFLGLLIERVDCQMFLVKEEITALTADWRTQAASVSEASSQKDAEAVKKAVEAACLQETKVVVEIMGVNPDSDEASQELHTPKPTAQDVTVVWPMNSLPHSKVIHDPAPGLQARQQPRVFFNNYTEAQSDKDLKRRKFSKGIVRTCMSSSTPKIRLRQRRTQRPRQRPRQMPRPQSLRVDLATLYAFILMRGRMCRLENVNSDTSRCEH